MALSFHHSKLTVTNITKREGKKHAFVYQTQHCVDQFKLYASKIWTWMKKQQRIHMLSMQMFENQQSVEYNTGNKQTWSQKVNIVTNNTNRANWKSSRTKMYWDERRCIVVKSHPIKQFNHKCFSVVSINHNLWRAPSLVFFANNLPSIIQWSFFSLFIVTN